ncbi:peptide chain release factor 3 [Leptospira ryugenii]|uniref:Peptide chain release factor 3 n=1 Tax=Leptospira ryugenii TaxID=1917863 RepID=A0A2P2DX31_9LEPT|nr:peptide chain release factor 3 [Leptospira ryugenii]GBF49194.1 peptide chain release factor 3 [Leptospira ryugenii]
MSLAEIETEVKRRRTFAIIAHPDAGKTTLTEKLLLYGGAIQLAGAVKARKQGKSATSDWMAMEKERGISITSAALQFEYNGSILNLLDTPGHEDFSEDTYRTLMAADTAVMVLDAGKGVEPQTVKLFRVCRDRGIPIITFINKMDRPTKDLYSLLDEIEKVLGIKAVPDVWPLGTGFDFKGVYDLRDQQLYLFDRTPGGKQKAGFRVAGPHDKTLDEQFDAEIVQAFRDQIELVSGGIGAVDVDAFLKGNETPVYFGSAVNNFGIELFLNKFLNLAPPPDHIPLRDGSYLDPVQAPFSAFVFKVQANMNKAHRDRIAFLRVCSGVFERGLNVNHNRLEKQVKLSSSFAFFGQDRNTVDLAYPGDIIGLVNPGTFKIGDVLSSGTAPALRPLPSFAPELFATISCKDTLQLKSFKKGLDQLAEEGILHLFSSRTIGGGVPIIGAMGKLQFEVFQRRLKDEYNADTNLQILPYTVSRWIDRADQTKLPSNVNLVEDMFGNLSLLFDSEWDMNYFQKNNETIQLLNAPPIDALELN